MDVCKLASCSQQNRKTTPYTLLSVLLRRKCERRECVGVVRGSQYIFYNMFGFVELESWKIRYKRRDLLCASDYDLYGKLSAVRIYDCRDPQVVYAGFMLVDGKWKPRNHHYLNAPDAKRILKRYQKEYAKRHPKEEKIAQQKPRFGRRRATVRTYP